MITLTINNQAHLGPLMQTGDGVIHLNRADGLGSAIIKRLTFANPAYQEAVKRDYYTGDIPQRINGYRIDGDRLIIPRGVTRQLIGMLGGAGVQYRVEDRRRGLAGVDFTFRGELLDFQEVAVSAMAARARTAIYGG